MAHPTPIDISNIPELVRIAEEKEPSYLDIPGVSWEPRYEVRLLANPDLTSTFAEDELK
jgi:hypothetical protein